MGRHCPQKHVLDKEVSENKKNHIRDKCKLDIALGLLANLKETHEVK
jgi:hypothetical protein